MSDVSSLPEPLVSLSSELIPDSVMSEMLLIMEVREKFAVAQRRLRARLPYNTPGFVPVMREK
jgi:predicted phosphatase